MGLCCVYVLLAMAGIACGLSLDQLSLGLIAKTNDVHEYQTPITGYVYDLRDKRATRTDKSWLARFQRDTPAPKPTIDSMHIVARVTNRFSETVVTSVMTNPTTENTEAKFIIHLPETAFISNYSMVIDGKRIVSEVKSKAEVDRLYEEAKSQNKTAGKVSAEDPWESPEPPLDGMEIFSVAVNVKAQSSVEFELTYLQLLQRQFGEYEQVISMRPNQIVQDFKCDVYIYDKQGLKDVSVFEPIASGYKIAKVISSSKNLHHIQFSPSPDQQKEMADEKGMNGNFIVSYDVVHTNDAGLIQVEGEYFAHYFSPDEVQYSPLGKNIIFVIDISGSMGGENKMDQTREAMATILQKLRDIDTFMMILFDDAVVYWPQNKSPAQATGPNKDTAKAYAAKNLYPDGGTNINDALTNGCNRLRGNKQQLGSNLIVFLTDGEATVGETNSKKIVANVDDACGGQVSIFSLAFGYSLDYELMKMVSWRTGGKSQRIRVGTSVGKQLEDFYNTIGTPIMYDVKINYPNDVVEANSVTQTKFNQFFKGSEIAVVGKLVETVSDDAVWEVNVVCTTNEMVEFKKPVDNAVDSKLPAEATPAYTPGFLQRLYAYMKIKDLLKEVLMVDDEDEQKALEAQALELALHYNLVTPLTSMLVVEPDKEQRLYEDSMVYGMAISFASSIGTMTRFQGSIVGLMVWMLSVV